MKTIFFLIAFVLLGISVEASEFGGPIEAKNQFPFFMHLNAVSLERARLEDSFSISLSHSTANIIRNTADWSLGLDLEWTELSFRGRKVFRDSFELGIEVPFLSFNSGFMDNPINYLHRTVGFSDYGRDKRPINSFLYEVKRNGAAVVQGELGGVGLSDIRLSAKKSVYRSDPEVSLKLDVELPTGDPKKGYGNGYVGTDASILLDKKLNDIFVTYLNLGVAFPGDLDGYQKVNLRQFKFGGVALEMAALRNLNLIVQLTFQDSPYPDTGMRPVDATAVLSTFGARYVSPDSGSYEFTFTEDPNTAGAPDFTVGLSYKKIF